MITVRGAVGLALLLLALTTARAQDGPGVSDGPAPGTDTRLREALLQDQILERVADGALDNRRGRRLLRALDDIRRIDTFYRGPEGRMTDEQARDIARRLEGLRGGLSAELAEQDARARSPGPPRSR
jgi:hypothetical protein